MQSNYAQQLPTDAWRDLPPAETVQNLAISDTTLPPSDADLTHFRSHFVGSMELRSDAQTVTDYLNAHQGWFCRCAQPMTVKPVGETGYLLTIGRYGSFGFEIEPQIGLCLLPPDEQGLYKIETIPDLKAEERDYKVDFQAVLQLVDCPLPEIGTLHNRPDAITHIEWTLDLGVALRFPRFIRRLPHALIQVTGDRLLQQIVRQVSRRLTAKVQDDFHANLTEKA
jgi:hypothetical protein